MNSNIGIVGIGVMGENLALNMESKGFTVSVYDLSKEKVEKFVNGRGKDKKITGTYSLEELAASLAHPRKIMMMVQ
ncbi:MAG: NADP-dependent phosphogluconate dehydrogenase, partial [Ignavibacteriales bacterium]|nr:NADP-dependent phosphogluconate dehydrogenase [Ignavibacteriales bacterium]